MLFSANKLYEQKTKIAYCNSLQQIDHRSPHESWELDNEMQFTS
jgi:hypothetical protein